MPAFRSVPVKRGDLVATISATGTVEPEAAVDVGAQVAGVIIAFGKDKHGEPINWGTAVEAGTVLAKIDDSLYAAAVETAKASSSRTRPIRSARMQRAPDEGEPGDGPGELEPCTEARTIRCARTEHLRSVPGQLRGCEGQPRGGDCRREPGNSRNRAGEGQPHYRTDQPRLLYHQVTGQGRR